MRTLLGLHFRSTQPPESVSLPGSATKYHLTCIVCLCILLSACGSLPRIGNSEPQVGSVPASKPVADQPNLPAVLPRNNLLARIADGFSLPELNSVHVDEYAQWSANHPTYLSNLFKRSEPFLFHFVERIEERGLPMEIALLPAVESAYRVDAVSRSKAVGLWQFLASSGKDYGLEQDWWYDGRRDVIASTEAALDYLTVLHARFDNDWFLALAAYNGGQGNLARSIRSNQTRALKTNYLALDLRLETRRYVPKLIALRNILRDPAKYGVTLPEIANKPSFTALKLTQQVDMSAFAAQANLDSDALMKLNSGFLRWATPPRDSRAANIRTAQILIPSTDPVVIATTKAALSNSPNLSYKSHRIVKGDTLGRIAGKYGVSISALKQANNLRSNNIRLGKNLLVPIRTAEYARVASVGQKADVDGSTTPRSSQAILVTSGKPTSSNNSLSQAGQWINHQVLRGETLWSISRRYSVSVNDLLSWNQLSLDRPLQLDQVLRLLH